MGEGLVGSWQWDFAIFRFATAFRDLGIDRFCLSLIHFWEERACRVRPVRLVRPVSVAMNCAPHVPCGDFIEIALPKPKKIFQRNRKSKNRK